MKKPVFTLPLFITISMIFSCRKPTVANAVEYLKYMEKPSNGLSRSVEDEEKALKITVQYKSPEYMAIRESSANDIDTVDWKQVKNDYGGGYHFSFKISSTVSGYDILKARLKPDEYLQRITYMSGQIQNDFKLVTGMDTLKCTIAHFERNYNVAPVNEIMLVFATDNYTNSDKVLLYEDKLFGIGRQQFEFKQNDIDNIPTIQ